MFIEDHINLMGANPLIGPNFSEQGPRYSQKDFKMKYQRWPEMKEPYNKDLIKIGEEIALSHGFKTQRGVYIGITGPNQTTRAELQFLTNIGGGIN